MNVSEQTRNEVWQQFPPTSRYAMSRCDIERFPMAGAPDHDGSSDVLALSGNCWRYGKASWMPYGWSDTTLLSPTGTGAITGDFGSRRKAADAGVRCEPVRHQEGMGDAFSPERRQGIQATAELLHPSGAHPTRELAPDMGGVARAGQEQARLEHRLLGDDGDQILKFHRGNLPEMASCRDIQALVHPPRGEDRDAPSLPGGAADRRHPAPAGSGFPAPDRGLLASARIPVESITHSGLKPITESERWMGPDCATTKRRDGGTWQRSSKWG